MGPIFLKSLFNFQIFQVFKSMLGRQLWPGFWILQTKFFRQISTQNCSNLLTFFSVKLMWKSHKQLWYPVQSSVHRLITTPWQLKITWWETHKTQFGSFCHFKGPTWKTLTVIWDFWSLDLLAAIQGIAFCVVLAFSFLSLHFVPFTQI